MNMKEQNFQNLMMTVVKKILKLQMNKMIEEEINFKIEAECILHQMKKIHH